MAWHNFDNKKVFSAVFWVHTRKFYAMFVVTFLLGVAWHAIRFVSFFSWVFYTKWDGLWLIFQYDFNFGLKSGYFGSFQKMNRCGKGLFIFNTSSRFLLKRHLKWRICRSHETRWRKPDHDNLIMCLVHRPNSLFPHEHIFACFSSKMRIKS